MARPLLSAQLIGDLDIVKLSKAMDKKERQVLFKTANFARGFMKRGMRRTKKAGPKGGFPASRKGQIRNLTVFAVDVRSATAVVGPAGFSKQPNWLPSGINTIPQLLNQGGTVHRVTKSGKRTFVYKPRPFVSLTNVPASIKFAENMESIPLGV